MKMRQLRIYSPSCQSSPLTETLLRSLHWVNTKSDCVSLLSQRWRKMTVRWRWNKKKLIWWAEDAHNLQEVCTVLLFAPTAGEHVHSCRSHTRPGWQGFVASVLHTSGLGKKFFHSEVYQASPQEQTVTGHFGSPHADSNWERNVNEPGLWWHHWRGRGEEQTPSQHVNYIKVRKNYLLCYTLQCLFHIMVNLLYFELWVAVLRCYSYSYSSVCVCVCVCVCVANFCILVCVYDFISAYS